MILGHVLLCGLSMLLSWCILFLTTACWFRLELREAFILDFVQVYPNSWTAIYIALDNVGMWNLRSEFWARQYLGQQLYLRVYTPSTSIRDEFPVPKNAILCGRASGRHTRPLWANKFPRLRRHSSFRIWKVVNLSTSNFIVECFRYLFYAMLQWDD